MNQINRSKIIGDISKAPKLGRNLLILFKKASFAFPSQSIYVEKK